MKIIQSKEEFENLSEQVYQLMNKGSENLSEEENKMIIEMGLRLQEYEQKLYPIKEPRTLQGKKERKMYDRRIKALLRSKEQ